MSRKFFRSKTLSLIVVCTLSFGTVWLYWITSETQTSDTDRKVVLNRIEQFIELGNQKVQHEGQACRVPALDVNAAEIMRLLTPAPKVVCNATKDWVEVVGSVAKITAWAKNKYGEIECSFTDIIRVNDHRQHHGLTTTTTTEFNLENSDAVRVYCVSEKGEIWQKVLNGIRSDQGIFDRSGWSKLPAESMGLNVLIFGLDSMSHNMWKRQLKKTYRYATEDLGGIALNGYNIVGDGTPQALIPILTGKTELELPDTRKRVRNSHYVNVYPFIWNDYRSNGYVTAWSEDMSYVGTFTYRLNGFLEQPVDHYMRTFYVEALPFFDQQQQKYCYGGISRFRLMVDFVTNMYEVYKDRPKFVFAFHAEYSHDSNNWVVNADDEIHQMLQGLQHAGRLNNTLLILMSDHGSRFANVRNTQQGKQEERLPGFIFVFPPWFKKKYPEAFANFQTNANRLTTPFDIHETLMDVLRYRGAGMGDLRNRGISLFKEVPASRTCIHARIEPHWCTCLDWETVSVSDPSVQKAVARLLDYINSLTAENRNLCAKLKLNEILWSAKLVPNTHLLRFKANKDYDGFVGDMSARMTVQTEVYQVKVSFNPGNMIFEASIKLNLATNKYTVQKQDISRINKYKDMTKCIEEADILHHLRQFCYCV